MVITRREISRSLCALGLLVSAPGKSLLADERLLVANTRCGRVRGSVRDGVTCFLGIPYGSSTTGANRFMPPRPPNPWAGVRAAMAYGNSCPQVSLGVSPFSRTSDGAVPAPSEMQKRLAALFAPRLPEPPKGEDCLALNIWTPAPDKKARPVMVWLHGGGFAVGSGSEPAYDGTQLAKRGDVVVVTINHRLNVFGHLYLGEIAGEEFAASGNVGMLDVIQTLQWIRDNVEHFGGDPSNVTIFGESGGAGKVSVVCAMPEAKGLFHRAIMQQRPCSADHRPLGSFKGGFRCRASSRTSRTSGP